MSDSTSRRISILAIGFYVASAGLFVGAQSQSAYAASLQEAASSTSSSATASNLEPPDATARAVQADPAPSSGDPTLPVPKLKLTSKLTVEDVTVTDAKRAPVHGLTKPEFELKEDGKPQEIRDFEEYGAVKRVAQTTPLQLPPNTYTNAQPPANGATVNVLLLDDVTTGLLGGLKMAPEYPTYARQQASNYLQRMPEGTRVAILQLGDGLRLVQGVTTDRAILLAALKAASYKPVAGTYLPLHSPPDRQQVCDAMNRQGQLVVQALEGAAVFLAGIKGRKSLIWFTPGIPWVTKYHDFFLNDVAPFDLMNDYSLQLYQAYGLLNDAQVALYPVDPRGLFGDPAFVGGGSGPKRPLFKRGEDGRVFTFGENVAVDEASLQDLADATGGVAYYNRNDLDGAIEGAIATGANYYSLAYVPPLTKYDGHYHTIDLKVDRPNLNLRYRTGYTSVDLNKRVGSSDRKSSRTAPPTESAFDLAMGHGAPPSTQIVFAVDASASTVPAKAGDAPIIGSPSRSLAGKHLVRYDFMYNFTGDEITLVNNADGTKTGSVEFLLAAYDPDGKLLNTVGQTSKFTVKPENVAGFVKRQIQMPLQFDLPAGDVFVRVGMEDVSSQKTGTLEIPENIAKR